MTLTTQTRHASHRQPKVQDTLPDAATALPFSPNEVLYKLATRGLLPHARSARCLCAQCAPIHQRRLPRRLPSAPLAPAAPACLTAAAPLPRPRRAASVSASHPAPATPQPPGACPRRLPSAPLAPAAPACLFAAAALPRPRRAACKGAPHPPPLRRSRGQG